MKLIAGPCVVESLESCLEIAITLKNELNPSIDFFFKASFKKANRTKISSFMGLEENEALSIIQRVKEIVGVRICTDVHETSDIPLVESIVDVIQIPAFLCRQTDLIYTAGLTGKIVNIKKGQFLSPEAMKWGSEKAAWAKEVWITERGTSFGYQDLIVDSTSIPRIKKSTGCTTFLDVTHSLQRPNQPEGVTMGGDKELSRILMRQAMVSGADGIFMEVHPNPEKSLSDKETILNLHDGIKWANEAYEFYLSTNEILSRNSAIKK